MNFEEKKWFHFLIWVDAKISIGSGMILDLTL